MQVGSSPLTRGKLARERRSHRLRRLIPAHAGKTDSSRRSGPRVPAHPRSRGENFVAAMYGLGLRGSSPLTRGKLHIPGLAVPRGRLIPAHAGKTPNSWTATPFNAAHPRSRGENGGVTVCPPSDDGSSPLTRGKRRACRRDRACMRLIPAHAGKTTGTGTQSASQTAHPRSRGENGSCAVLSWVNRGSSPLTRGKRGGSRGRGRRGRLIPAHAGKTLGRLPARAPASAHPRSRGENVVFRLIGAQLCGSSPLTRGKRCK